jgi:Transposase DNA-binding
VLAVPTVEREFEGLEVGDPRLRRRACAVVAKLSAAPDVSFPRALKTVADREAFYRLLANPRVSYGRLVASHAEQTVTRMVAGERVLVIHDTTEMAFNSTEDSRQRLGRARSASSKQGFFAHVSLAVSGAGQPLGTLGMSCWARQQLRKGKRKISGAELAKDKNKESARWGLQVNEVERVVGGRAPLLHVMDREADAYPLLSMMVEHDQHFVIRVARERLVFELDQDGFPSDEPLPLSHGKCRSGAVGVRR